MIEALAGECMGCRVRLHTINPDPTQPPGPSTLLAEGFTDAQGRLQMQIQLRTQIQLHQLPTSGVVGVQARFLSPTGVELGRSAVQSFFIR
ncbi:MAG: hypothetical protein IPK26_22900 [Planctomycetes bacterium]|nr:hypothetical protein [Planctomycetota bacterium]